MPHKPTFPPPPQVWDTHMLASSHPVSTIQVNPGLRPHLSDLYETDAIFDKFECAVSGDGRHLATGTYNNNFQVRAAVPCCFWCRVGCWGWRLWDAKEGRGGAGCLGRSSASRRCR
jgi:hypothetical protein